MPLLEYDGLLYNEQFKKVLLSVVEAYNNNHNESIGIAPNNLLEPGDNGCKRTCRVHNKG